MATIVIDTDTTWTEDPGISSSDLVVVDGAVLTIEYPIFQASVTLQNEGKLDLTSSVQQVVGDYLTVSGTGFLRMYKELLAYFDQIEIPAGSTLKQYGANPASEHLYSLRLRASRITIDGSINLNGAGYPGPAPTYSRASNGYGPGKGKYSMGDAYAGGAGYGGKGGTGRSGAFGGDTYGSKYWPIDIGSSGAANSSSVYLAVGGAGGGAIELRARYLVINGTVSANGGKGSGGAHAGGGSGGSILIIADEISGNGLLSATGGGPRTSSDGCGGGGRIAIYYKSMSSPTTDVSRGTGGYLGDDGTVHEAVFSDITNFYFIESQSGSINVSFYKCQHWEEGESHGGDIDWSSPLSANNIFDDVTNQEREEGSVDYRKIYVANMGCAPWYNVKAWISQNTLAPNDEIFLTASGTSSDTLIEASGYTFVQPSGPSDPNVCIIGTLNPGEYHHLWIKRLVEPAISDGYKNNSFRIKIGQS